MRASVYLAITLTLLITLIGACAPAAPTAAPAKPAATTAPAATAAPAAPKAPAAATSAPAAPTPTAAASIKRGGTLTRVQFEDTNSWDPIFALNSAPPAESPALEALIYWELADSKTGKHELKPQLAESGKMPSVGVWVLEIRQGVHWQKTNTPAGQLMNGREVTADDIVSSLKRLLAAPKSWMNVAAPADAKATTVEKTGPWEVTINTPIDYMISFFWIIQGGGFNALYPPEVVAKYGDVGDWHNTVGTGPFMLTDYTKGTSLTFTKNPDYWGTNPAGPGKGDKLPYIDTYKQLIIPDVSTQLAAFRTGKVDALPTVTKEDEQPVIKENPKLISYRYFTNFGPLGAYGFAMNINKP
ncbi:MAG: ABC transporter substrate-binding protein, partial [Chloroflexi bacterium]|nr:ABC transporter substrate-binding protein [Chloroflexota bacterium]